MPRIVMRDNQLWFGPCADSDLAVIGREPLFANHGVSARADASGVQVFVTLPHDKAVQVQNWYLRNHRMLTKSPKNCGS